jgi:hypothetical protein
VGVFVEVFAIVVLWALLALLFQCRKSEPTSRKRHLETVTGLAFIFAIPVVMLVAFAFHPAWSDAEPLEQALYFLGSCIGGLCLGRIHLWCQKRPGTP